MKKLYRRKKQDSQASGRITNETVAEHRERILAGGRKFKYPVQYAKNRLVVSTTLIILAAFTALAAVSYVQLYHFQTSNIFFYRLTKIAPVPVASVDGELASYNDYLMYYRSSEHYLKEYDNFKPDSPNGKRQLDYIKRETMNNVISDAYTAKLADIKNISVSQKEVDEVVESDKNTRDGKISQEAYDASAMRVLNWSPEEYREVVHKKLLTHKVAYAIDEKSKQKADKAAKLAVADKADFTKIAKELADKSYNVEAGASGDARITSSIGGGIGKQAAKLNIGEVSGAVQPATGDGYYVIRLNSKTESTVNFDFIHIPIVEFKLQIKQLKDAGRIKEFINVPDVSAADAERQQTKKQGGR